MTHTSAASETISCTSVSTDTATLPPLLASGFDASGWSTSALAHNVLTVDVT